MTTETKDIEAAAAAIEQLSFPEGILPLGIEGRKIIAEAVLKAVEDRRRAEMPALVYRMYDFDDWGMIRQADGTLFATVRRPVSDDELAKARSERTDPYEELGRLLIKATEGFMTVPAHGRRELINACAALVAEEKAAIEVSPSNKRIGKLVNRRLEELCEHLISRMKALEDTVVPPQSHRDDIAVDRFAEAMKTKLAKKRRDGYYGWDDPDDCSAAFLSDLLVGHVEKGDPVDVGNFAMMIHQRGESIANDRERYAARRKAGGNSFDRPELPNRERMREKIAAAPDLDTEAGSLHPEAPDTAT